MADYQLIALLVFFAGPVGVLIYYDIRFRRLPNIITVCLAVAGLGYSFWQGYLINSVVAATILFVVFLIFALKGYMGGGDLKMAAALGIWLGYPNSVWVVCAACFLGVVTTMVIKASQGTLWCHLKSAGAMVFSMHKIDASFNDTELDPDMTIPFGAYMGICSLIYVIYIFTM